MIGSMMPFQFEGADMRVTLADDGQPWFNAIDVCAVLDFGNPYQALATHVDVDDLQKLEVIDSLGRVQQANHVNESGLYSLILGSRKPQARRFKRWVTSEVLPTIRRTGSYFGRPPAADMRGANTVFWLIPGAVRAARVLGLSRDAAIIAANRTVATLTGIDTMQLLDIEPPASAALPVPRPEADFLLAWQTGTVVLPGGTPLPFVPCTGRQLYAAYLAWCRARGIARPMQEGQFIGWVGSRPGWQAGRSCATRETPGSRLFKNRKMVLPSPDALTRPDGVGVTD